jgi:hypothetical protein
MTTQQHVKPAVGCLVRDPVTYEALPVEGKLVEMNSYWVRKAAAGDIEIVEPAVQDLKPKGDKQ